MPGRRRTSFTGKGRPGLLKTANRSAAATWSSLATVRHNPNALAVGEARGDFREDVLVRYSSFLPEPPPSLALLRGWWLRPQILKQNRHLPALLFGPFCSTLSLVEPLPEVGLVCLSCQDVVT